MGELLYGPRDGGTRPFARGSRNDIGKGARRMDELEWWEFDNAAELAKQAAGDIGFVIESAIEAHGDARLALSGEADLDPLFSALAKSKAFDWSKVTLMPSADRLVGLSAQESRYRMLEGWFGAKGAEIVSVIDESALGDPNEAARLADARLSLQRWPLDFVCLGMDDEGGTAGLVAGSDVGRVLDAPRGRRAVGVKSGAGDLVTLTAATLTGARAMMIVISGAKKREVLEQAIKEGPLASAPIGRLLSTVEVPLDIFWSPDEA
jgi:6-phosphogluconolactonase